MSSEAEMARGESCDFADESPPEMELKERWLICLATWVEAFRDAR